MKFLFALLVTVAGMSSSFAAEDCTYYCTANTQGHESFCESLSHFACQAHSVCSVSVSCSTPEQQGGCYAHVAGHESFCASLDRFSCSAHSAVCSWGN